MPSLNRIVLINTHLQGVVELVVDGHTNICGTNASGKTTLQRLVPVFYGEYPSRVVPTTRDSFERWYLPTEQSFIVYEYRNLDGQLCQAVLAAAKDGRGVDYRLVHKAFDLADYTRARQGDTLTCLGMTELGRQLKQAGVTASHLLNTREYRAILQNDRGQLGARGNSGTLRSFARQFSLCETGHSLRHIEKLVQAVHSREGKMETVRSMIAAILEEEGVTPPTSLLKSPQVDAWIRESQLVQGFNALRPDFEKLEREYHDLLDGERRLGGLLRGYRLDEPRLRQTRDEQSAAIEQSGFALKQLEEGWKQRCDGLHLELSAARGEISRAEDELKQIEQQYQGFLDAEIEQARADLDKIEIWRDELENLRGRYRLLTDRHQDVKQEHLERREAIKDQRDRRLDQLRDQQTSLGEQRDARIEARNSELEALKLRQQQERETGLEGLRDQEGQHKLERERLDVWIQSAGFTEDENRSLAILDRRLEQTEADVEAADARVRESDAREQALRRQREEANVALRAAAHGVGERQAQREEVQRLLYPGQHSLLEFLRRELPGWEAHLGKTIDSALLQRADLKPALIEPPRDALFGVCLDLSAIELPEHAAAEPILCQRLQLAEDALKDAENRQQAAEKSLGDLTSALDEQHRELTLAGAKQRGQREDWRRLKDERRACKEQLDEALRERRNGARKQRTELEARIQRLAGERQQWLEDLRIRHGDAQLELNAHWREAIGRLDHDLRQLRDSMEEGKRTAKAELDACTAWFNGELKSRGLDEQEIIGLNQRIGVLDKQIKRAEQRRPEVRQYDDWFQLNWMTRKPKLQDELDDNRRRAATLDQALKSVNSDFKRERSQLTETRERAMHRKNASEERMNRLKSLLGRFNALKLPRDEAPPEGEIDERLRLGDELLYERGRMLDAVKGHVERFDTLIAGQSGSSLAETWERGREDSMMVDEQGMRRLDHRRLVPHLAQLLTVMVPQSLMALREQGRMFGLDLNNYYAVLVDIDRRIAAQSARITREVSEDLFLDGVSDSAVRIRSRIGELEFWPDLRAFITAFKAWREDDFSGLPGEDYIGSLRRALDIIGRSAQSGNIAGLLEIELRLREGRSDLVIRTDRQLSESSSHGMAYLILCKFLLAFTRLLRGNAPVTIHWPIDELGTLHYQNVKKIFDACTANGIHVLGAFPNPDSEVLGLFANRYIVNKQTRQLQVVKPRADAIAAMLRQRQAEEAL
ncbi:ATP-binding protein [Thiocystis violascens]|uniref:ATP-binding protein n=1 Tax=Thiocystis violascens (strain ATCC 17096 / DSM 198 / 6111) TaxID=765911 RepID=I3YCL7_THIV6|nr:ATP-binding protein [Thiocystis violascens]AFL74735.1 Protein of unknown function (DUF3584) [Thiocystis violascens DSM 198]